MKSIILLFTTFILFSIITPAQDDGVNVGETGKIWYDSLYHLNQTQTIDLELEYPNIGIVLQNKSATITDTIKIYSLTRGYESQRPFRPISYSRTGIVLKDNAWENVTSTNIIVLSPNTTKEYFVANTVVQLLEYSLLNVNANAKVYFWTKASKYYIK